MVNAAPRPASTGKCTCIWQQLAKQQEEEAHQAKAYESLNPVKFVAKQIPGQYGAAVDEKEEDMVVPASQLPQNSSDVSERTLQDVLQSSNGKKGGTKKLVGQKHPDVLARQLKKRIAKSSENKLGTLFQYRSELVETMTIMIPARRPHDPTSTHPPMVVPVPHTLLCTTCDASLLYSMYYSSVRTSPYLREHSVAAYLALVDDAVVSMDQKVSMEKITHHELDSILRAELAVVEWRLSMKLSRFHAKTGMLDLFPVRIGEFAELTVNRTPPSEKGGVWSKLKSAVGAGGSPPKPQSQGADGTE